MESPNRINSDISVLLKWLCRYYLVLLGADEVNSFSSATSTSFKSSPFHSAEPFGLGSGSKTHGEAVRPSSGRGLLSFDGYPPLFSKFRSGTTVFKRNSRDFRTSTLEKGRFNSYIIMNMRKRINGGSISMLGFIFILSIIGAWLLVNIYIFPKLGIRT
jgi:hypothetical protein